MKIDINKKYKTRSGAEVEIYTTDSKIDKYPVVGCIANSIIARWTKTGSYVPCKFSNTIMDLVEVKDPQIGDLCSFWDSEGNKMVLGFFQGYSNLFEYPFKANETVYKNFELYNGPIKGYKRIGDENEQ